MPRSAASPSCRVRARIAACFHRGEVYVLDVATGVWTLFADGLQEPLGIVAEDDRTLVVMQRPELTRLRDEDGDGRADAYETVCDDFGMSGNYHEFAFGPARGPDGRYYVGLNTASNGAGIRAETRGAVEKLSRPGRMYACVPYRGWIVAIDPVTGALDPYACGLRSPDGLGWSPDGSLFVTDNQGDWLGTSKLYRIEEGGFYGHVSSLVWREGWDRGDPLRLPVRELDDMRTRAAVLFPHGSVANSPTQPVWVPERGSFAPFAGQMLVGEMNSPRILRVMVDEVAGWQQGATVTLVEGGRRDADVAGDDLPRGVHRLAFDRNGALWTGHTALSWAGGNGLTRITWTGEVGLEVAHVALLDDGFEFRFTRPLDPASVRREAFAAERFWYEYHRAYGSDRMEVRPVVVESVDLVARGRAVRVHVADLKPGRVYQWRLGDLRARSASTGADAPVLGNRLVTYTCDRLRDGTIGRPQWEPPEPVEAAPVDPVDLEAAQDDDGSAALQAEDAQVVAGPAVDRRHAGFRGTGYVDYAKDRGDAVVWSVSTKRPAEYVLEVRYALDGGPRTLQLELDGEPVGRPIRFESSGGWASWADASTRIRIPAGAHTIGLVAVGSSGPNVDEIRLRRAD